MGYRGRFAPSPTGFLHFGSLVTALGSYLDARQQGGQWLVRMEDLDTQRRVSGAAERILSTLEAFGLRWDGPVVYQSQRESAYREAADWLRREGWLYPCGCSRQDLRHQAVMGAEGPIYTGVCRAGLVPGRPPRSLRVRTEPKELKFYDRVQGSLSQHLEREVGDFVVRRVEGVFAYQLAVVVDDAWQGITHVVRGADLLLSTPRQIHLQRLLGLPTPEYAHLPLAVDGAGRKLSKQCAARPVDPGHPVPALLAALAHLGQALPPTRALRVEECLAWALEHWDMERVPKARTQRVTEVGAGGHEDRRSGREMK